MNKYIKPKVKRVILDCSQSVLQVCKIGGVYFFSATLSRCMGAGPGDVCLGAIKGAQAAFDFLDFEDNNRPS